MSLLPAGYPSDASAAFKLLGARTKLSIDDLKVLALLEQSGEAGYFAMAAATDNEEAKALLMRNGQEERGHAHRLLKAIKLLGGDFVLPEDRDNPFHTERKIAQLTGKMMDAIAMAEGDGDVTYQAWADAEPNAEVAKIYRQNASEESRHGQRAEQVKALLQ
ncbi:MAG: ferritin-like domain-containing protein [Spongiibacteraceae bacterium]